MIFSDEKDEYTLATGKRLYANHGIIGLGPEPEQHATEGFDGGFESQAKFTPAERREVADEMIRRWSAWAERP